MSNVIFAWFINYIAHSTILIAAVWLVTRWLRSPIWCDLLWKLALVGAIATATLITILPSHVAAPGTRIFPRVSETESYSESVASGSPAFVAEALSADALPGKPMPRTSAVDEVNALGAGERASGVVRSSLLAVQRVHPAVGPAMLALWGGGTSLLVLRLVLGHLLLMKRLRNRREVVTGEDFELMQKLRLHHPMVPVRLSTADAVQSPITMLGSEIVLPRETFDRLTTAQKRSILAHELAHVRRLDPHWLCAAETLCALLFLQPLNQLVRREMHLTAEFLCDDAALRQTGDRRALAETLAELAATLAPVRPMTVAAMAEGGSNLFRRVRRVLSGAEANHLPIRFGARLALVTLPLLAISLLAPRIDARMDVAEQPSLVEASEVEPARPAGGTITVRAEEPAEKMIINVESPAGVTPKRSMTDTIAVDGEGSEFNTFARGVLDRSFHGPEGATSVEFRAQAAEVALDGTWVRLLEPDGFVRVTQVSSRGPKREVEVTAGENLRPRYVYRVDGEGHAWCSDAERVIASSALGKEAYERRRTSSSAGIRERGESAERDRAEAPRTMSAPSSWETHLVWKANVSNSENTSDGRREVRVKSNGFHYNPNSGEIWIEPGGYVEVEERHDGAVRSFRRSAETIDWRGEQTRTQQADREAWLVKILTANSSIPPRVIRSLARE